MNCMLNSFLYVLARACLYALDTILPTTCPPIRISWPNNLIDDYKNEQLNQFNQSLCEARKKAYHLDSCVTDQLPAGVV